MRRLMIIASVLTGLLGAGALSMTLLKPGAPTETLFGQITPTFDLDQNSVTLGTRFTANQAGRITDVRFYKGPGNTGTHVGAIYSATGNLLARTKFTQETASGWQTATFASPVKLKAGMVVCVAVFMPRGRYAAQSAYPWPHSSASLTATSGVYKYGSRLDFPTHVYESSNYFIDVKFKPRHRPTLSPPPTSARSTTSLSAPPSASTPASSGSPGGPAKSPFFNGLLTNDPKFFPIAVWSQTLAINGANYKAIGVNTFLGLNNGYSTPEIDAADANGLYAIGRQSSLAIRSPNGPKVIPAWLDSDEPDNAQPLTGGGYGPCIPVSTLINKYRDDKTSDPLKRPVMLDFGRGVSDINWVGRGSCTGDTSYYQHAAAAANIFAYDIYPVNNAEPENLQEVAQGVDNLRTWVGPNKPVWVDIETTPINQGSAGPTPAQTEFEVWSAIIHGARGINYFCHIFSPTFHEDGLLTLPEMKAAVQQINARITKLAPVINAGTPIADTVTSSAGTTVPVDTMTKRYRGATYIIAADMRDAATTGTFKPAGAFNGTVTVLDESRTLKLSNGSFTDKFAPYGVHIYKITAP